MLEHHSRTIAVRASLAMIVMTVIAGVVLAEPLFASAPRPRPIAGALPSMPAQQVETVDARTALPGCYGTIRVPQAAFSTTCRLGAKGPSFRARGMGAWRRSGKTRRIAMFPKTTIERSSLTFVVGLPRQRGVSRGIVGHTAPPG